MDLLPSVKAKLEQVTNELNTEYDEVLKKFKELYNSEPLNTVKDEVVRQTEAARALRGSTLRRRASMAGAKECKVAVLAKGTAQSFKTKSKGQVMTKATAVAVVSVGDKFVLTPVGFWNEHAKGIDKVESGSLYTTKLIMRKPKKGQLIGSVNASGFENVAWNQTKEFDIIPFIESNIKKGVINQLEVGYDLSNHIGKYGVLDATILRFYAGEDPDTGREYANYTVVDDSTPDEYVREFGGLTCWLPSPDMLQHGQDSHLYIFGQVRKSRTGDINFSVDGIVPILSFPLEQEADEQPDDDIMEGDILDDVDVNDSDKEFPDDNNLVEGITPKMVYEWILNSVGSDDDMKYTSLKKIATSHGCNEFTLEQHFQTLTELGILYEPSVGMIRLVDTEWPDLYDDYGQREDDSDMDSFVR